MLYEVSTTPNQVYTLDMKSIIVNNSEMYVHGLYN